MDIKTERNSFVFYKSFHDSIKTLKNNQQCKIYSAMFEYIFEKKEPTLDGVMLGIWVLIKPQLDANEKRFRDGQKGAEYGSRGGRPRKKDTENTPANDSKKNPIGDKQKNPIGVNKKTPQGLLVKTPNVNVNDNVNVNVNDKEKEKKEVEGKPSPPPPVPKINFKNLKVEEIEKIFFKKLKIKNFTGSSDLAKIESEKFYNYYTANGWKVGRNKMQSIEHTISNWIGRMDNKPTEKKIDYAESWAKL